MFDKGIAVVQLLATVAVVVLGAYLVQEERRNVVESEGHSLARAYAVQLGQIARGIEDMQHCKEKLLPFAEGAGTRIAFSDLKILGTFLTTTKMTIIDEASNELDRLFPASYTAPPSGSKAAYGAWTASPGLRHRVRRVIKLLRPTLRDFGSFEPGPDHCAHRREPSLRRPRKGQTLHVSRRRS